VYLGNAGFFHKKSENAIETGYKIVGEQKKNNGGRTESRG
jgi:hypothetical protein